MTLIDTSVWVEWLRSGFAGEAATTKWEDIRIVTCGPIVQEVLQGLDDSRDARDFRDAFLALPRLEDPVPIEVFLESADLYRAGRRKGHTIRSTVDCLIAAIALRHDAVVLHRDRDYAKIARYTNLQETN
jgi:predicted nucleic acid-binding protein